MNPLILKYLEDKKRKESLFNFLGNEQDQAQVDPLSPIDYESRGDSTYQDLENLRKQRDTELSNLTEPTWFQTLGQAASGFADAANAGIGRSSDFFGKAGDIIANQRKSKLSDLDLKEKDLKSNVADTEAREKNDSRSNLSMKTQELFEQLLSKPKGSYKGLSYSNLEKLSPTLASVVSKQLQMDSAKQTRDTAAQTKENEKSEKEKKDLAELNIPGYDLSGEVRPTSKEAQDLRSSVGAMKDFSIGVERLKELINEHGSTELTGTASGEIASLAANLKLTLKEVQKLGVLSASDIAFLEAQIPDPSSYKSMFTRKNTSLKQLETAKKRAESLVKQSLAARSYTSQNAIEEKEDAPEPNNIQSLSNDELEKRIAELQGKR